MGIDDLIFHSDGGGQYYDKEFIQLTGKYKIKNSRSKSCYENAMVESLNGVIKNKYLRHRKIDNLEDLKQELDRKELGKQSGEMSNVRRIDPLTFEPNRISDSSAVAKVSKV